MTPEQKEKIRAVKNIFIPTNTLQKMLQSMKRIRELAIIDGYKNRPDCMFVTGETGVGKTTFIEQYLEANQRYDVADGEEEKTVIPVLYCSLPKSKRPVHVVEQLLVKMGDELQGKGDDVPGLTNRLVHLAKKAKVELIIIDEFQHAIDAANEDIFEDIGEWFKIFIDAARIPIVFLGVPWAKPILDVNDQLRRRVRKNSYTIENYTLDTFNEFQMFLQRVEQELPIKPYRELWEQEMAFRLFAASRGNLSELMEGIIQPACIEAIYDESQFISERHFIDAVEENTDWLDGNNPLAVEIDKVEALQQKTSSYWNENAERLASKVVKPTYATVKFSNLNLQTVLSKR
ncbi:ATP-binding protein [Rheinheimera riviphila]|nr:ATP-binding protein [Rheinheimera riviphila]